MCSLQGSCVLCLLIFADEEELRNVERNVLKRKKKPMLLIQDSDSATPTYGVAEGGILKSAARKRIKSAMPKKVIFNLEVEEDGSGDENGGVSAGEGGVSADEDGEVEEVIEEYQELDDSYFEIESVESMDSEDEWVVEEEEGVESECDEEEGKEEEEEEMDEEDDEMEEKGATDKKTKATLDEEAGSAAVTVTEVSKYVPPQLRETGKSQRLTKKVQGLMNRCKATHSHLRHSLL